MSVIFYSVRNKRNPMYLPDPFRIIYSKILFYPSKFPLVMIWSLSFRPRVGSIWQLDIQSITFYFSFIHKCNLHHNKLYEKSNKDQSYHHTLPNIELLASSLNEGDIMDIFPAESWRLSHCFIRLSSDPCLCLWKNAWTLIITVPFFCNC